MAYEQPYAPGSPEGSWSSSIFGCSSDCSSFCCALWCPCAIAGRNAEVLTDGFTDSCNACCYSLFAQLLCCACSYTSGLRTLLREKYLLPEKPQSDCFLHTFCHPCALSQEYRELKNRGWNPAIGYAANVRHFQSFAPPTPDNMTRL